MKTKTQEEFLKSQIGNTFPVLFETQENDYIEGYTPNYTRVIVKSTQDLTGKIKNVLIKSVNNDFCEGEIV